MVNQTSSFATDAFGETIVRCIGCDGWTSSVDEVCEVCEENGLSRDLILMEQEWDEFNDDFPMSLEYDDDDPRDYDVGYQDDYY